MVANYRSEAIAYREEELRFTYDPVLMNAVYIFLKDLDMHEEIPKEKDGKRKYIMSTFEAWAVENGDFPDTIEFVRIFPLWMSDVLQAEIEVEEFSVKGLRNNLNEWLIINWDRYKPKEDEEELKLVKQVQDPPVGKVQNEMSYREEWEMLKKIYGEELDDPKFWEGRTKKSYYLKLKLKIEELDKKNLSSGVDINQSA